VAAYAEEDNNVDEFSIAGGETKTFAVVFIGAIAMANGKQDRLPPPEIAFQLV